MKDTFDGLVSRLDMAKERISELEEMSVETFKSENQREKRLRGEKRDRISENGGTTTKSVLTHNGNTSTRKRKAEEIFKA